VSVINFEWHHNSTWRKLPVLVLTQPLTVCGIQIPVGTQTDGATVPVLLRWLFPPLDRYLPAVILHDYLLQTLSRPSRSTADNLFAIALRECNVPRWRRWCLIAAVRLRTWWVGR
jgi:hypothetical protein